MDDTKFKMSDIYECGDFFIKDCPEQEGFEFHIPISEGKNRVCFFHDELVKEMICILQNKMNARDQSSERLISMLKDKKGDDDVK